MSRYRKNVSRKNSRKSFTKYAKRTHKKNLNLNPMRGGIRL